MEKINKINGEDIYDKELIDIIEFELIPLIKEYWFDNSDLVAEWSAKLFKVLNMSRWRNW